MRSLLVLLIALAAISAALAIVCEPHICDRVRCAQVKATECEAKGKDFHLMEHAGFCGCCNACVKFLKEHESCLITEVHGPIPHNMVCAEGLHCDHTRHVCLKNVHH